MTLTSLGGHCPKCGSHNKWLTVKAYCSKKGEIISARHSLVCCGQIEKGGRVFLCEYSKEICTPEFEELPKEYYEGGYG